jgi:hypothetical protein
MKSEDVILLLVISSLLGFVLGNSVGHITTLSDVNERWRREAVKRDYAEWGTDARGNPVWRWKCDAPES